MNMTRFEPWSLMEMLHRDLDRLAGRQLGAAAADEAGNSVADWVPAIDVVEEKDRFVLRADLPGVEPKDIDISMEKGTLKISGERRQEKTENVEGMRRIERVSGKFYRRFSLPDTVDADAIKASSANGILEVTIPKQPQVEARRITVQAA